MYLGIRNAVIIARIIDNGNKRANWEQDMRSNIHRWECSVEKLENICNNTEANIRKNRNAIEKAEDFLSKLTTGKSQEWYERVRINRDKYEDLNAKVVAHEDKISSAENRIIRLKDWIRNDENKLRDINSKISDIEGKISDVEYKIRN